MKRFIVSGFELFFDLVALITKNGQKFYKTCEYWEPQQGGKFTLLNKVVIRKTTETGSWFEVADDLGRLRPFSKGEVVWKFSTSAPLRVTIADPKSSQVTTFMARCIKEKDGRFSLSVKKTEKKVPSKEIEQILTRVFPKKTRQPKIHDDYRKDPQARKVERRNLNQQRKGHRNRNWTPWPKKPLTTDQKNAMMTQCHRAPLTQKLVF